MSKAKTPATSEEAVIVRPEMSQITVIVQEFFKYGDSKIECASRWTWNNELRVLAVRAYKEVVQADGSTFFDTAFRLKDGAWPSISDVSFIAFLHTCVVARFMFCLNYLHISCIKEV